jgi:hypothetical protein
VNIDDDYHEEGADKAQEKSVDMQGKPATASRPDVVAHGPRAEFREAGQAPPARPAASSGQRAQRAWALHASGRSSDLTPNSFWEAACRAQARWPNMRAFEGRIAGRFEAKPIPA